MDDQRATMRAVLGTRNPDQPGDRGFFVLFQDGYYERLPAHLDSADLDAVRHHYGVAEVVRAPELPPICSGLALDGPVAGMQLGYVERRVGARTFAPRRIGRPQITYVVVDADPDVVLLRHEPTDE